VTADINALRDSLIDEIIRALGLTKNARLHRIFATVFHRPIEQFSSDFVTFDQMVENESFGKAAAWLLTRFCSGITAYGTEYIPPKGPVLATWVIHPDRRNERTPPQADGVSVR
jgi:hypothetical protein